MATKSSSHSRRSPANPSNPENCFRTTQVPKHYQITRRARMTRKQRQKLRTIRQRKISSRLVRRELLGREPRTGIIVVGAKRSVHLMPGQDSSLAPDLVPLCLPARGGSEQLPRLWMSRAAMIGLQFGRRAMYAVVVDTLTGHKASDLRFNRGARAQ